jgi:hypothetical protein
MKTLIFTVFIAASALAQVPALPGAALPKRPLGVPADAQHFNGRWYKVVLEKKSWHAARDKCKDMGGQLVTIPDAQTWEFVKGLTTASVWLGASDEVTEGVWKWVDGTPVSFTSWFTAQPDNARSIEHFLATYKGRWNDVPKSGEFLPSTFVVGFVCQW